MYICKLLIIIFLSYRKKKRKKEINLVGEKDGT